MTQTPNTGALLERLRDDIQRHEAEGGRGGHSTRIAETLARLDAALSAGAPIPAAWQPRPDPATVLTDTVAERMNRGLCPNCSTPSTTSQPDGEGAHTWICGACDRTWRFALSADDLAADHYAVVFSLDNSPQFSRVFTTAEAAYERAAGERNYRAAVHRRPGRGRRSANCGEVLMVAVDQLCGGDVAKAILHLSYHGVGLAYVDRDTLHRHLELTRGRGLSDEEWEKAKPHLSGPAYDERVSVLPVQSEFLDDVIAHAGISTDEDDDQKEAPGDAR